MLLSVVLAARHQSRDFVRSPTIPSGTKTFYNFFTNFFIKILEFFSTHKHWVDENKIFIRTNQREIPEAKFSGISFIREDNIIGSISVSILTQNLLTVFQFQSIGVGVNVETQVLLKSVKLILKSSD